MKKRLVWGDVLVWLRGRASQYDIAELAGLGQDRISKFESHRAMPTASELVAIVDACQMLKDARGYCFDQGAADPTFSQVVECARLATFDDHVSRKDPQRWERMCLFAPHLVQQRRRELQQRFRELVAKGAPLVLDGARVVAEASVSLVHASDGLPPCPVCHMRLSRDGWCAGCQVQRQLLLLAQ